MPSTENVLFCQSCGHENRDDANYCQSCGGSVTAEKRRGPAGRPTAQCARCKSEVPAGAKECSHCGHNPGKAMRRSGGSVMLVGVVMALSVIGSPIGVPIALLGYYRLRKGRSATVESEYGA